MTDRQFWMLLGGLALFGAVLMIGRRAAEKRLDRRDADRASRGTDDEIDYEELERAEREVRDLDPGAKPEDGFEGDDWGPGTPRPPTAL